MPEDYHPKPKILPIAALVFFVIVVADSWFRWATYQYRTFDLAFYVHSYWLALNGGGLSTILDVSIMGNHAEPICYLFLPLFWMWKHPMLLVVIQALLLITMPFTGYRIARRLEFSQRGALFLGLATLLAPATGFMALHEFHPETLAAPLILLMLEARLAGRAALFWFWFLLSVACKENVALMLGWMCAVHYLIERARGREWQLVFNIIPGAVALGWVALYGFWLGPALNGGRVDYGELYSHVGGLGGVFRSPGAAVAAVSKATVGGNLVWGLFVPFLLLPVLRFRWVIVAAPIFAQHLLSWRPSEWQIHFHYAAPLLPILWFAAAEACARLFWRDVLAGWVAVACLVCQFWIGPIQSVYRTVTGASVALEKAAVRTELLKAIPDGAPVVAGQPYLSHLAMRPRVHSLHHVLKGLKTLSRTSYVPPEVTDAVFVDAADHATFDAYAGHHHPAMKTVDGRIIMESEGLLNAFLKPAQWRSLARNEVTLLLRENTAPSEKPLGVSGRPLNQHHRLAAAHFAPPLSGDASLILLTYEIERERSEIPWLRLYLQGPEGARHFIVKGPIGLGKPGGQTSTEAWAIRPPKAIPAGKYRAILLFYDPHESFFPGKARFEKRTFDLGEFEVR